MELSKRRIESRFILRADLTRPVKDVDLVISLGGDGTFLDVSHYLFDVPILGVNSSSSSSFGHFCLAKQDNLSQILDMVESGQQKPQELLRLELLLNNSLLRELVLNETLVCHSNPAATTRYFIKISDLEEEQRSSGMWIGPPAGSTGAMKAAGGAVLPITSRQLQYVVREPWLRPQESWKMLKGILPENQEIRIVSQMRTGTIFIDGQHIYYPFVLGDELIIRASRHNLKAYVLPDLNNRLWDKSCA